MEVAAYREPSVLGRKRAFGADSESAMKVLRQRFKSELVAVRGLCDEAKKIKASPLHMIKRSKIEASPPPVIKRRNIVASPPPEIKRSKVTHGEKEQLKADLEKLEVSELPHHIRDLLEKHSHVVRDGYMEITVQDEDILEIRKQLDDFLRHQERNNMMAEEEDEDVDIVGGVSPLAIASPPPPLADEEDEYVDICDDASPAVVTRKNLGGDDTVSGGTPCSSSGSSDSTQAERDATLLIAREKARQDVLRTERAPKHMTTETIHPTILQSLGIFEYDYHRGTPYTLLPRLGLFLKDDDDLEQDLEEGEILDDLEEGEIPDDLEEGEIRF